MYVNHIRPRDILFMVFLMILIFVVTLIYCLLIFIEILKNFLGGGGVVAEQVKPDLVEILYH